MAVKKLKLEYLPEAGEYKPAGTLGKHRLFVLEKTDKYAIVKDYNGIVLKIRNGALYNCGTVLYGADEQEARKWLWKGWWIYRSKEIKEAWEHNDSNYNANYARAGERFATSSGASQILKAMKELNEQYEAHKQLNAPSVFKSCATFLREEKPQQEPKHFNHPIEGEGWKFVNP